MLIWSLIFIRAFGLGPLTGALAIAFTDTGTLGKLFSEALENIDGKQVANKNVPGSTANWDASFRLALGNELSGDRPWLGTYFLVAIYDRELTPAEIVANFRAGTDAPAAPPVAPADISAELFDTKVAAIIANHCLECHDAATRKGKLDLSHKANAFAGGREGTPIIPGKSGESLLWESVASDEMPDERIKNK